MTITAPASQVCLGNTGGHFAEVISLPSASPPFSCSSTAPLCKPALTCAEGLCPLFLGSWQGCVEGGAQLRKKKLGTKCCSYQLLFPALRHPGHLAWGTPTWVTESVSLE